MSEYGAEQLAAGFRAMRMLAGLVQRGGRPAAVAPTIPLRAGEKQYGWFPVTVGGAGAGTVDGASAVTVDGGGRRVAVITNLRLLVGAEVPLRSITRIRPIAGEWSVAFEARGREPFTLSGPWVPWLSVVICAELYGTAWPPAGVPAPRRTPETTAAPAR